MLVRTRPADGYASLSMVNLEYPGLTFDKLPLTDDAAPNLLLTPYFPMDGINEKGLSIAVLSAKGHITCQRTGKIGLTTSSAIRVVLDCCATVREAVETLSRFDMYPSRGSNYHFQLADASGDYAVVEYADGQMHVLKEQYVTNFFLTPDVSDDRCGQDRYDKLKKTMDGNGGVFRDTSDAMKALAEVSEDGTRWSAVFNVTDRSLHLALEHDYTGTYNFSLDVPEL
jgi:predicted choloylglycine hydrolase